MNNNKPLAEVKENCYFDINAVDSFLKTPLQEVEWENYNKMFKWGVSAPEPVGDPDYPSHNVAYREMYYLFMLLKRNLYRDKHDVEQFVKDAKDAILGEISVDTMHLANMYASMGYFFGVGYAISAHEDYIKGEGLWDPNIHQSLHVTGVD